MLFISRGGLFFLSVFFAASPGALAATSGPVTLENESWSVMLWPDSLRVEVQPRGGDSIAAFPGRSGTHAIRGLRRRQNAWAWRWPDDKVSVSASLTARELSLNFLADGPGVVTWPILRQSEHTKALIWPRAEGCYVPLADRRWTDHLVNQSPWNTIETLSMPFWGLDCGGHSLTFIATNPFNNEIVFTRQDDGINAGFSHEVTPFAGSNVFGIVMRLGDGPSPVEPARQFRQWLVSRREFVSMQDKIRKVPWAARLAGAAHVYLWGDAPLCRHDIPRSQWRAFCHQLAEEAEQQVPSPGKHIRHLMTSEAWKRVIEICDMEWPDNYVKGEVTDELSRLLGLKEFYDEDAWRNVDVPPEAAALLAGDRDALGPAEFCRMNSLVLHAAYRQFMIDPEDWGDGVSSKMLRQFADSGFDRLRLCVAGWEGIERRPHVAAEAGRMGYLFGTYDSYHSIHDPVYAGTDTSWPTAQFDQELFSIGPIVNSKGEKQGGFRKTGYKLSPLAARPWVEKRVKQNMGRVPYSYYFIDCDATGEVYDDYSPLRRAGEADDAAARLARMAWISDTYRVPVGSEGGNAFAAGVIHVAEGIFAPLVGWGDADMNDRDSEFYVGGYYPPDAPRVFFKPTPLKEEYEYLYYDPRFRLPLYETVFHDSVVATHWWGNASLKFTNVADTVELTELLYMTAPLYHLNLDEFAGQRDRLKKHYAFFSPLHRELGFGRMMSFDWLTEDRLVQKTTFDDSVELIANFSVAPFTYGDATIPGRSVLAVWKETRKTQLYTPGGVGTR